MELRDLIEGKYIRLQKMQMEDAPLIFNWRQSASGQFMNQPDGYSLAMQEDWMQNRPDTEINYIIVAKETGEKVGMVALVGISIQDRNAEIGRLLLAPEFLKKSNPYGLEALKLCATEIIVEWNFHKINGNVLENNVSMLKLQKYMGMEEEGFLKDQKMIGGKMYGLFLVALFESNYRKKYLPRINMLLKAFEKSPITSTMETT